ncbi:MAG: flagellar hook assembly protein FlgD [Spirochaetaceae bacterium]|nr:MAG: flagellar hook assembly protein FlgD [Spirochaetaceae bacterium]
MEISNMISGDQLARLESRVNRFNSELNQGKAPTQSLGKDDFLKLLITQLQNQDPISPMEDREFIAQMAQFSSLEQMTNMSGEFAKLARMISSGQALSLLGRTVEVTQGEQTVSGRVTEVTGGDHPQLMVNGTYYDYSHVRRVQE